LVAFFSYLKISIKPDFRDRQVATGSVGGTLALQIWHSGGSGSSVRQVHHEL